MENSIALAGLAYQHLEKGALLMTGIAERNPMTIGWCQLGRLWNQSVCTVYVRPSRYSHELLERDGLFTVAVPLDDTWKQALGICGSKSGRDVDKKKELGLEVLPARAGGIDTLKGNLLTFECSVVGKSEFEQGITMMDEAVRARFYNIEKEAGETGDLHTVYYGTILAAYRNEG